MAEAYTAPLTPGIHGARWLAQEFGGGLSQVRDDLLADVPHGLQPQVDGFQVAGRLAEIGTPYAEMSNPGMTPNERRAARLRSAQMMAYVGFIGRAVAMSGRQEDVSGFLKEARGALLTGENPSAPTDRYKAVILEYGRTLHGRLGFDERTEWHAYIGESFRHLNQQLLAQLAESLPEPGRRDPERLLEIAVRAGGICAEMGAIAAAAPNDIVRFRRFLRAARAFGGIGFLQDQITNVKLGRMETYASAAIREQGEPSAAGIRRGMQEAHAMRKKREAELVDEGMRTLKPGRERKIFGSQLWFALKVYPFQRLVKRPGRTRRIARQLAY